MQGPSGYFFNFEGPSQMLIIHNGKPEAISQGNSWGNVEIWSPKKAYEGWNREYPVQNCLEKSLKPKLAVETYGFPRAKHFRGPFASMQVFRIFHCHFHNMPLSLHTNVNDLNYFDAEFHIRHGCLNKMHGLFMLFFGYDSHSQGWSKRSLRMFISWNDANLIDLIDGRQMLTTSTLTFVPCHEDVRLVGHLAGCVERQVNPTFQVLSIYISDFEPGADERGECWIRLADSDCQTFSFNKCWITCIQNMYVFSALRLKHPGSAEVPDVCDSFNECLTSACTTETSWVEPEKMAIFTSTLSIFSDLLTVYGKIVSRS